MHRCRAFPFALAGFFFFEGWNGNIVDLVLGNISKFRPKWWYGGCCHLKTCNDAAYWIQIVIFTSPEVAYALFICTKISDLRWSRILHKTCIFRSLSEKSKWIQISAVNDRNVTLRILRLSASRGVLVTARRTAFSFAQVAGCWRKCRQFRKTNATAMYSERLSTNINFCRPSSNPCCYNRPLRVWSADQTAPGSAVCELYL